MNNVTIKSLNLSGVIHVFDINTKTIIYKGTEENIPKNITLQIPVRVYCCDDVLCVDVHYSKVYYDTEAKWYYYESFFRSQYDEHTKEEKEEYWHNSFDEFMKDTLMYEPIEEVNGAE